MDVFADRIDEIFDGPWDEDDPAGEETRQAFIDQVETRFRELSEVDEALDMKKETGVIQDISENTGEGRGAEYTLVCLGAAAVGDEDVVPESEAAYFDLHSDERDALVDEYAEAAIEEHPDQARELLETIEQSYDTEDSEAQVVEQFIQSWIEVEELKWFYRMVIAAMAGGAMPFKFARAMVEHHDPWWEGKEPDSDIAEMYRETK